MLMSRLSTDGRRNVKIELEFWNRIRNLRLGTRSFCRHTFNSPIKTRLLLSLHFSMFLPSQWKSTNFKTSWTWDDDVEQVWWDPIPPFGSWYAAARPTAPTYSWQSIHSNQSFPIHSKNRSFIHPPDVCTKTTQSDSERNVHHLVIL